MRNLVILGSTGSIGTQALDVISRDSEMRVVGLSVHSSIERLKEQVEKFHPRRVCIFDPEKRREFDSLQLPVESCSGMEGLCELASMEEADEVVVSVVGMIGIQPTIAALRAGKQLSLANKETLVCAGHIIMPLARERGITVKPIDSEHSAIWQSLQGEKPERLEKILLTASGGPFRGRTRAELRDIRKEDALRHPNWSMGRKITIDSATMVNKGLEMMEASWLFSVPMEKIEVLVQPESIVHSAIQLSDGSVKAQLGLPDMRIPIEYALYYPDRFPLRDARLDLAKLGTLHFEAPDLETFEGLRLAVSAGKRGGSMPTVYNAANEEAVALFLRDEIRFLEIPKLIREAMASHEGFCLKSPGVPEVLETEAWARQYVREHCHSALEG